MLLFRASEHPLERVLESQIRGAEERKPEAYYCYDDGLCDEGNKVAGFQTRSRVGGGNQVISPSPHSH